MSILPVRIYGDPVLREKAVEVSKFDDALRRMVADMQETMRAYNGVGLAANQIGVAQRVLVVDEENIVEQRHVELGTLKKGLRVIKKGLAADEKYIIKGIQRARPGLPVDPQEGETPAPSEPASEEKPKAETRPESKPEPEAEPKAPSADKPKQPAESK